MTDQYRPLKNAFGRFSTGIAIAACKKAAGDFAAITINSFASVSLDPPMVLWCVEKRASTYPDFMATDSYSVSILNSDQQVFAERFARYDPIPLDPQEVEIWETGAPLLKQRLAGFDCKIAARHEAGDHVIMVGEIMRFDSADRSPLVYFASNYFVGLDVK